MYTKKLTNTVLDPTPLRFCDPGLLELGLHYPGPGVRPPPVNDQDVVRKKTIIIICDVILCGEQRETISSMKKSIAPILLTSERIDFLFEGVNQQC